MRSDNATEPYLAGPEPAPVAAVGLRGGALLLRAISLRTEHICQQPDSIPLFLKRSMRPNPTCTPRLRPSPSRARMWLEGTMAVGPMSASAAPG